MGFNGTSTAWEAKTTCLWYRAASVLPVTADGRVLFQTRASWKWHMGGLYDIGVSETMEKDEEYKHAAARAIVEEIGSNASVTGLEECCKLSFAWTGAMRRMHVCEQVHHVVYRASINHLLDPGPRDSEVESTFFWHMDDYASRAQAQPLSFAPWVHAISLKCPACFQGLWQGGRSEL